MVHLIFKALLYVSYFSIVVPIYFFIKSKHVLKHREYRLLGVLFFVCAMSDAIGYVLIKNNMSNLIVNNVYFVLSFGILSLIYTQLLQGARIVIYLAYAATLVLFVFDSCCAQSITGVQSYVITLCSVLALGYSIVYFEHLRHTLPVANLTRSPFFWVNASVGYYFGLNLFIFVFSTYIFENLKEDEILAVWIFHNLNNIIKNILLGIGMYYASRADEQLS